jgi:hypothetical protein
MVNHLATFMLVTCYFNVSISFVNFYKILLVNILYLLIITSRVLKWIFATFISFKC